ncbi:MAG: FAD binding domain-containing protein, partial [bacterium]
TWFFLESKELTPAEALDAVSGNICRCTGYASIKRSIDNLLDSYRDRLLGREDRIDALIEEGFLLPYFKEIPERIKTLSLTGGPESSRERPGVKDAAETEIPDAEQVRYIVAGGTDLLVQRPESLIDAPLKLLADREEMSGIIIEDDAVKIGAAVPMEDLFGNEVLARTLPRLKEYLHLIAASPIRQRATLAGNIVNASPIGDMSILLLALKGFLILSSDSGDGKANRTVRLKGFFRGYKELELWQNEVVRWVCFPLPKKTSVENFEKVSRRTYLDIASVNSAVQMDVEGKKPILRNVSLAAGGVAPIPLYLKDTSALLEGNHMTVDLVKKAGDSARDEVSPISDVRGSAEYKRKLVRRLVLAHFTTLFPETISWEELE